MWSLNNRTKFAAERGWARDRDGAEVWLVAVKGSFDILPDGRLKIAKEQEPVCLEPKYLGEPGKSSLRYDSDLVLTKKGTDVVLHGHAYAPKGAPAGKVDVSMRVGPIQKALRVHGNRGWRVGILGLKLSDPEPFAKMPLVWERSYGGADPLEPAKTWDVRNPVGRGWSETPERLAGQLAINLEDPKEPYGSASARPAPAGFGPVAAHWKSRARWGGTYDAKWEKERQPLVPADFDDRFYQCAPEDQQAPGFLKGGENVELYNLSPSGSLRFTLPRLALGFETTFGDESVNHRAVMHTVILEPDVPRVLIVWHTSLRCHSKVLKLSQTTVTRKRILSRPPALVRRGAP